MSKQGQEMEENSCSLFVGLIGAELIASEFFLLVSARSCLRNTTVQVMQIMLLRTVLAFGLTRHERHEG